jgi:hypothetical protein
MQMAGCERGQPGGCIRRCCVEHPKPESEEDDERSATPEPSAHPTVRELKCQREEAGISTDRMLERPKLEDALTNDKASKKRRTATPRSAPAKPPASHPIHLFTQDVKGVAGFRAARVVAAQKPEFDRGWAGLVGYTTTLGKPTAVQRVDCGPRSGWTCYKADSEGAASPPRRGTEASI